MSATRRSTLRTAPAVLGLLVATLIVAPPVLADCSPGTDCFQLEQRSGPPGATVAVTTTMLGCTSTMRIELVAGVYEPTKTYPSSSLVPTGEATYEFVVPKVAPGTYSLALSCSDGPQWTIAPAWFTVTGTPDTSTASESDRAPSSVGFAMITGIALVALIAASLRPRRRVVR